jgi:hypothetical protein
MVLYGFSTVVPNPLRNQEKNSKKFFLGIYSGTKFPFLSLINFSIFFWLQLVPGTTTKKKTASTWY